MTTTIYFDMDGTIADFYNVNGWLDYLINRDATPYKIATPLVNPEELARVLNELQAKGYRVAIISWLAKNSTPDFDEKVTKAKIEWIRKYFANFWFDEINIVAHGTPKENYARTNHDILFDDEIGNRENWCGVAHDVNNILGVLANL